MAIYRPNTEHHRHNSVVSWGAIPERHWSWYGGHPLWHCVFPVTAGVACPPDGFWFIHFHPTLVRRQRQGCWDVYCTTVMGPGVLLKIWLKQGKEKGLLARILKCLEKARKRLSRRNSTIKVRKCEEKRPEFYKKHINFRNYNVLK